MLLGLAFEVYEPPSQSLVADATPAEERPVAFGLLSAALAAAGMVAGLLAAVLAGFDLRWLFVADAVTCVACAASLAGGCRVAPRRRSPAERRGRPWRRPPAARCCSALGTAFAVVYLQVTITLPLTVTARGLPVAVVGLLLTVSAATVVLAQPLLALPRWRRPRRSRRHGARLRGPGGRAGADRPGDLLPALSRPPSSGASATCC